MNTNTIEKYAEEFDQFAQINEFYQRGFPMQKTIEHIRNTLTAVADEARREALEPFKGARNPGEWEDSVWWEGRLKALEEMRALLKKEIAIHLEIERTHTSYPKDWHEGNRNGLYDALTHIDSLTK
jgi:hypothetical protein